jgi:hypothetical protein
MSAVPSPPLTRDPGSFRDPESTVMHAGGEVLRGLRAGAVEDWEALAASDFFGMMTADGRICATKPLEGDELAALGPDAAALAEGWPLVLRHERIPFVSYPFEWTFSMLRDAASAHLEILTAALAEDITTKDGSAYNLQWRGAAPVFIDVGSFQRLRPGEPWAGYRQFCQTFLYPLMLTAHLGVDFQPWLRAQIDGIEARQMRALLGGRHLRKAGVLKHVRLHAGLERGNERRTTTEVRGELRAAGFSKELLLATVRALTKLVGRLDWQPDTSHWVDYRQTCTYAQSERDRKAAFVGEALAAAKRSAGGLDLVVDLGANDGAFSRIAAEHADYVLAVESDHATTDALYRTLRGEGERRVLPLVVDLANPSPGMGWRGAERPAFGDRARPAAALCLALVHHLAIGRNVPLPEIVDWLAGFGGPVVVEFVDPADPMAAHLLANKPDGAAGDGGLFGAYRRDHFERLLAERFEIDRREELPSGTRILYAVTPRG